jgi:SAM-dependent methyltransferase
MRLLDEARVEERAVDVVDRALLDTREAFDGVAGDYHRSNAGNPLLCAMRQRTLAALTARAKPGATLLDLGCGPGTDDEVLARAGYRVTAIDSSAAMVREAQSRIAHAGLGERVRVHHLGIHELDRLPPGTFDVACSNFGPLNCVPSLDQAARSIWQRLRPGGVLIASVIGRICPWEIALYLSRGDWPRLRIRFAREAVAVPLEGRTVWMRYYTPSEFEQPFAEAGFRRDSLRALGLFVPPPYLQEFAGRHPALIGALQALEDVAAAWPAVRTWGDHFLITLRKP